MDMKCGYCGSQTITYDSASEMYYCKDCGRLMGEDEVEKVNDATEQQDEVGSVEEDEYEVIDGENLSGASLLILNIFMLVPIINILIAIFLNNSDIRREYKKCFSYRAVTFVLILVSALVYFYFFASSYKSNNTLSIHNALTTLSAAITTVHQADVDVNKFTQLDFKQIIESRYEPDTDNSGSEESFILTWDLVDGVTLTGQMFYNILDAAGSDYIILVQTKQLANRYSSTTYRNLGFLADGSSKNESTSNYFYEGSISKPIDLYFDDYGENVFISTGDLYNSKYIYYVNPKNNFKLNIIHDSGGETVGFVITEVN